MEMKDMNNRSVSCLYWLSVVCHCVTISYCVYLTVSLTNVHSELTSIKEEITLVKESIIHSTITAHDVQNGDSGNEKERQTQDIKGDFSRMKRGAPGRPGASTGAPGVQGIPGRDPVERGQSDRAPGNPGRPNGNGSPSSSTLADTVGAPAGNEVSGENGRSGRPDNSPTANQGFRDVTYVRWGKHTCVVGDPYYSGYAAGFTGTDTNSVSCVPYPLVSQNRNNTVADARATAPGLSPVKFNLQGVSGALNLNRNNKPIQCALCHARRTEVFTVVGWSSCRSNGNWRNAYTGYLMTSWRPNNPSSTPSNPICVDSGSGIDDFRADSSGPSMTYVQAGAGLWIRERVIPCAVCIKVR